MGQSNKKKSQDRNSFSVKTSLSNGWKEKQKCPVVGKENIAKTQKEASNGKGRDTNTLDKSKLGFWSRREAVLFKGSR
ncbi:hypothetical protein GH733_001441 [Mirounga leonina]|nr:hypothetical protein GH733_001441 [Mirounga leonina]